MSPNIISLYILLYLSNNKNLICNTRRCGVYECFKSHSYIIMSFSQLFCLNMYQQGYTLVIVFIIHAELNILPYINNKYKYTLVSFKYQWNIYMYILTRLQYNWFLKALFYFDSLKNVTTIERRYRRRQMRLCRSEIKCIYANVLNFIFTVDLSEHSFLNLFPS